MPQADDLADLNRQLMAFCMAERDRTVAHESATIGVNFESEKASALALPTHAFAVFRFQCRTCGDSISF